ncbi:MAG: hypothetical protein ABEJ89_06645 [Haloarculaceae archaeon]
MADASAEAADAGEGEGASYSGVLSAVPYAFRASDSRAFQSYVVIGGLITALVALGFVSAVIVLMSSQNTGGAGGGTFTFSRAFFILVGLLVVGPLLAPILLVARRHRRTGSTVRYDRTIAATGYLFVLSLYVALLISAPPQYRDPPTGALAPLICFLYGLPPALGILAPVLAAGVLLAVHRRLG